MALHWAMVSWLAEGFEFHEEPIVAAVDTSTAAVKIVVVVVAAAAAAGGGGGSSGKIVVAAGNVVIGRTGIAVAAEVTAEVAKAGANTEAAVRAASGVLPV